MVGGMADSSGIIYENLTEDEEGLFRGENLQDTSDADGASSQDEDAGSLHDFVVGDEEDVSEASSDSGIVAVSPPAQQMNTNASTAHPRHQRQARLQALLAARAQRGRGPVPLSDDSEHEDDEGVAVEHSGSDSEDGYEVVQNSDYDSDEADDGLEEVEAWSSDGAA